VSTEDPAALRARDLATIALALVESVGPAARGLCVYRGLARVIVRVDLATDDALAAVAEDRGLRDRAIIVERRPAIWYRRASGRWPTLWLTATGPRHAGSPPADAI